LKIQKSSKEIPKSMYIPRFHHVPQTLQKPLYNPQRSILNGKKKIDHRA
jgi:hypothetical protein